MPDYPAYPSRDRAGRKRVGRFAACLPAFCFCVALFSLPYVARAGFVIDPEIETVLRAYADPILKAADLPPSSVIVAVDITPDINAYAYPGFVGVTSGLFLAARTPDELRGVIAHEAGHIAGGHVPRLRAEQERGLLVSLAAVLLGIGAIFAGGNAAEAGVAAIIIGPSLTTYKQLGFSRALEASADNAALTYLERAGYSARGLLSFFKRELAPEFSLTEEAYGAKISPYILTHPRPQERVRNMEPRVLNARFYKKRDSPAVQFAHDMARARLFALLNTRKEKVLAQYPERDTSPPARYARALMYAQTGRDGRALREIRRLIADIPDNPFLHEMQGSILSGAGRLEAARHSYRRAIALAPKNPVLRIEFAHFLTRSARADFSRDALKALKIAQLSPYAHIQSATYELMARAHGVLEERGEAETATAAMHSINGNYEKAIRHACRALATLAPDKATTRLRAEDVFESSRIAYIQFKQHERARDGVPPFVPPTKCPKTRR